MPVKIMNAKILTALLLMFSLTVKADESVSSLMQTDFAKIHANVAKALHKKYPQLFFKSCDDAAEDDYRCGEIPFGDILEGGPKGKKLVFTVKIPGQSFSSGGAKGTFPETEFPIYISRSQNSGAKVNERLIDKSDEQIESSAYFGRDIYMRLFAEKNQLFGTACMYSPGVTVSSPEVSASFTAKKNVLWGIASVKSDIKTKIEIEPYSYDAMKSCVAFRVSATLINKELEFESEIIATQKPKIIGLKKGKFVVDVSVKGGNFLGKVVNTFAKDKIEAGVKSAIEKRLDSKIDKMLDSDLENGQWVEKFVKGSYHDKLTNRFGEALRRALARNYVSKASDIGATIVSQCLRLASKIQATAAQAATKEELLNACQDFTTARIESFEPDAQSQRMGCYKDFTRVTDIDPIAKPTPDFLKDCKFNHRLEVKVRAALKPLASCLVSQWKENYTGSCEVEIRQLQNMVSAP